MFLRRSLLPIVESLDLIPEDMEVWQDGPTHVSCIPVHTFHSLPRSGKCPLKENVLGMQAVAGPDWGGMQHRVGSARLPGASGRLQHWFQTHDAPAGTNMELSRPHHAWISLDVSFSRQSLPAMLWSHFQACTFCAHHQSSWLCASGELGAQLESWRVIHPASSRSRKARR